MASRSRKTGGLKCKPSAKNSRLGRPHRYTRTIADELLRRIEGGETLTAITKDSRMPSADTVRRWRRGESGADEDFCDRYARAREEQQHYFADLIREKTAALTALCEREKVDHAHVQAVRLEVDSLKWLMSKLARGAYGDRQEHEVSVTEREGPAVVRLDWSPFTGESPGAGAAGGLSPAEEDPELPWEARV